MNIVYEIDLAPHASTHKLLHTHTQTCSLNPLWAEHSQAEDRTRIPAGVMTGSQGMFAATVFPLKNPKNVL